MIEFLDKKLEKYKLGLKNEQEINQAKYEKAKGNELAYGDSKKLIFN
jgi:hypothetical protein